MSTLREGSDVRSLIESEQNSRVSPSKKMRTLSIVPARDTFRIATSAGGTAWVPVGHLGPSTGRRSAGV